MCANTDYNLDYSCIYFFLRLETPLTLTPYLLYISR